MTRPIVVFLWPCYANEEKEHSYSSDSASLFNSALRSAGLAGNIQVVHRTIYKAVIPRGKKPPMKTCRLAWPQIQEKLLALEPEAIVAVGAFSFQMLAGKRKISEWGGRMITDCPIGVPVFGLMNPDQVAYLPVKEREFRTQFKAIANSLDRGCVEVNVRNMDGYRLLRNAEALSNALEKAKSPVAFDYEATDFKVHAPDFRMRSASWSWKPREAFAVDLDDGDPKVQDVIRKWLESPVKKIAHNAKYETRVSQKVLGVTPKNIRCTMLMHHLVAEEAGHALDVLASAYTDMGGYDTPLLRALETGYTWATVPMDVLWRYNCADSDVTWRVHKAIEQELANDVDYEHLIRFHEQFVRPMMTVLCDVENNGMFMSRNKLRTTRVAAKKAIAAVKAQLRLDLRAVKAAKKLGLTSTDDLNLKSPVHAATLLFDVAGITPYKTTKAGEDSTSDLELIDSKDPLIKLVIEARSHLHDLSVLAELESLIRSDQCVSSDFYQPGTVTWRLASKEPPLQNLPRNGRVKSVFTSRFD